MKALEVSGLSAWYGPVPTVVDITLAAESGAITAIVGPNGAGKSTFLKALFGVVNRSGSIRVRGVDVGGRAPDEVVRLGMAYVPQEANVFESLSVEENLEIGAIASAEPLGPALDRVWALFPDLLVARQKPAGSLSGGQRNMLALARGLMSNPSVVLMDEPTAGLAPIYVDTVWNCVRSVAEQGAAVVVVEQNVSRALRAADWAYVFVNGRNRLDGPAVEVAGANLRDLFLGTSSSAGQQAEREEGSMSAGIPGPVG